MLRSLALLIAVMAVPAWAQGPTTTGPGGGGAASSALGVYVDLDANGNVVTVYAGPQDQTHPTTEWLPINDARVQAFYAARPTISVPTGIRSQ